jgi:hypothetical protein
MGIHFYELFITFCLSPLKLDQIALFSRFSSLRRSGVKPETNESRRASVARGDSVLPRKTRDTRSPIVKLPAESDVLAGHVIEVAPTRPKPCGDRRDSP